VAVIFVLSPSEVAQSTKGSPTYNFNNLFFFF